MKGPAILLVCFVLLAGCGRGDGGRPPLDPNRPDPFAADPLLLPRRLRTANYAGGSCMHASLADVLNSQGFRRQARWWRETHAGAAAADDLMPGLDRLGLDYVATFRGDESVLWWCSQTGRPAAIHWQVSRPSDHAVTFMGFARTPAGEVAYILDNNRPAVIQAVPRARFLATWHRSGGIAITVLGTPLPPRPW